MSPELISTRAFDELDVLCQDLTQPSRELHEGGGQVIGHMCCLAPVEIFTALNVMPFRITGNLHDPVSRANAFLETAFCPFVQSCFDLALNGSYDFLDGLVIPHSCDSVARIYDVWYYHRPYAFSHFLNVPHMVRPASYPFYKNELRLLRRSLEKFTGTVFADHMLRDAVELHNENRRLLREICNLRKPDPPLISGSEMARLLTASTAMPVEQSNNLLGRLLDEVRERTAGAPTRKPARVLLWGPDIDDEAFVKLVEDCGANIIIDDMCLGTKHFLHDVELTEDPLDGIAERYLGKITCPRTFRASAGNHQPDIENRLSYLKELAREWNANLVICRVMRRCDSFGIEAPDVCDYFQRLGYPVLQLEGDCSSSEFTALKPGIEAFLKPINDNQQEHNGHH